ncbi:pullulanase, type I [Clostridium thermobutyricum]|uniref:Pullulanase, type I n=1 Tax=Clostridium thermobutyricum TaxID=29372 RepID=N9XTJ3_9CLOT|nr:type I pullulanase [Clostridium thermobutyricum]ENZ03028.1 pullulanase, type I [Clostridium thermobutyricum]
MNIKDIYKNKKKIREIFNSSEFEERYTSDLELGAIYSKESTIFRLWTPVASEVKLVLFSKEKDNFTKIEEINMSEDNNGVWIAEKKGDLDKIYYRFKVKIDGKQNEVIDPNSKAVSANGEYSMVINLEKTNPENWENDVKPEFEDYTDAIIYEMHIRDFTIDENSGAEFKGKYKGVIEKGTRTKNGFKTCLDHVKDLGVTHLHLLPTFDYKSVDEKNLNVPQYNWGYDPENYNCPEGSYSTNPFDGDVRIKEFKEMVYNLHKEGLRVVMDVVYNHTYEAENSLFNKVVPYYYYREDENGDFSDASACGNETASDRSMFRKFMIDSLVYWAKEYHIDGFRFDLMGIHDIETMKLIRKALDEIDNSIIIYGEGWTGGDSPLKEKDRALKKNTVQYGELQIAAFSDDIRDAIKGDVFIDDKPGFVNGGQGFEESIKCGIVASTNHSEVNYKDVIYSDKFWANEPYQTVTYASAHDNYTLWDKLQISATDESEEEKIKMNKLVAAIVLTSQGISFIHAGEELLRTKCDENGMLIENSFKSSDLVNKLDWTRKEKYIDIFNYYKGLIKLRKNHKAFRMNSSKDINERIEFMEFEENNLVGYTINGEGLDEFKKVLVLFNGNKEDVKLELPSGTWTVVVNEKEVNELGIKNINEAKIDLLGRAALVLVQK